jgi:hypothetical protein
MSRAQASGLQLRLERRGTTPVSVLVLDRVDKPTAN